jgi:hypothetical protein
MGLNVLLQRLFQYRLLRVSIEFEAGLTLRKFFEKIEAQLIGMHRLVADIREINKSNLVGFHS